MPKEDFEQLLYRWNQLKDRDYSSSHLRLIGLLDLAGAQPVRRAIFIMNLDPEDQLTRHQLRSLLTKPIERRPARDNMIQVGTLLVVHTALTQALKLESTLQWLIHGGDIDQILSVRFAAFIRSQRQPNSDFKDSLPLAAPYFAPLGLLTHDFTLPLYQLDSLTSDENDWLDDQLNYLRRDYPAAASPIFRACAYLYVVSLISQHGLRPGDTLASALRNAVRHFGAKFTAPVHYSVSTRIAG